MTFPCLICGELPVIPEQQAGGGTFSSANFGPRGGGGANAKKGGTTIRTLSKDVSDKIFQNLCRHLYVKTEPYWFIQNPGEQMPLCANCSAAVLEIYTLQTKVDQFQAMIKKQVWKLERVVADTEITSNWMATREEQENEEVMWNTLPCPPVAIKIARERHHKFRQQVLQNFKSKIKLRQKMRSSDQHGDDMLEVEPTFTVSLSEPVFDGERQGLNQYSQPPAKRSRMHNDGLGKGHNAVRSSPSIPIPITTINVGGSSKQEGHIATQAQQGKQSLSIQATGVTMQDQDFMDDGEVSDSDPNSQVYPDVQIVCTAGPMEYFKEEPEYSNSGDGEEQDGGSFWNVADDNFEDDEVAIPEGEDVVWLAPNVPIRKALLDQMQNEQLKPSVFLRKLAFAVFGLKTIANSSGISGSNKPGAKPSLDRFKFEALREFTIDTYGIRENPAELDDLNRKIRTICCDARKALKRRGLQSSSTNNVMESLNFDTPHRGFNATTPPPSVEQGIVANPEEFALVAQGVAVDNQEIELM